MDGFPGLRSQCVAGVPPVVAPGVRLALGSREWGVGNEERDNSSPSPSSPSSPPLPTPYSPLPTPNS
ncbi:hypothetical protein [Tolypothrix sp. VBCCA 56010]|uniref:hypothetical protein n=1 Tax=Tolypothrix sp. VBCCA 56010 TaxID=3137731 RepID=UPI003D7C659C